MAMSYPPELSTAEFPTISGTTFYIQIQLIRSPFTWPVPTLSQRCFSSPIVFRELNRPLELCPQASSQGCERYGYVERSLLIRTTIQSICSQRLLRNAKETKMMPTSITG